MSKPVSVLYFLSPVFAVSIVFSGCAFKKDDQKKKPAKEVVVITETSDEIISSGEVKVVLIPRGFNDYIARISWPIGRKVLVSIRHDKDSSRPEIGKTDSFFDSQIVSHFDLPCPSSRILNPEILSYSRGGRNSIRHDLVVNCPWDRELSGTVDNLAFAGIRTLTGRLFLKDKTHLNLGHEAVDLNLIGLHVEGSALIEIESQSSELSDNPQLRLRAQSATGKLFLKLKGADGPSGNDGNRKQLGPEYQKKLRENSSLDGSAGSPGTIKENCSFRRGVDGGESCKLSCKDQPGNGSPGKPGIDGLDGDNGDKGLPSANASIDIHDVSKFELNILFKPGAGGRAGLGGEGQLGGKGGSKGLNPKDLCQEAAHGADGKAGKPGNPGVEGPEGECGLVTLNKALSEKYYAMSDGGTGHNCVRGNAAIRILEK